MQTSSLTQQTSSAALGFSETLQSRSALQWKALDGSSAGSSTTATSLPATADSVALGSAARAASTASKNQDDMQSLLSLMQGILQQVLGVPFATLSALPATPGKDNTSNGSTVAGASQTTASAPASNLDTLTSSILAALGGSPDAARSGGTSDSLLSALKNMGNAVAGDALNLYNSLAAQSQSQLGDFMSKTAAQGGTGSYQSMISVQETQTFSFSAHGKLTTASGQSFEFSLDVELQASVSIASVQSGSFGTQSAQGLTLGQQAGSFSGASVDYSLQNLLQSFGPTQGNGAHTPAADTKPAQSDSKSGAADVSDKPLAAALAHLKLWQPAADGKTHGHRQQLTALLQALPQHGSERDKHKASTQVGTQDQTGQDTKAETPASA